MRYCWHLPRLTVFNVLTTCILLSLIILTGVISRVRLFVLPLGLATGDFQNVDLSVKPSVRSPELPPSLRTISSGETIQVEDLQVHIATAFYVEDYPAASGFNLFMNGWVRHNTSMSFKCCLLRSSPDGSLIDDVYTEVRSYTYHIYEQWLVDMQNAEFSCSVSRKQIAAIGDANFSHVVFVKEYCLNAPPLVMKIIYPQPVPRSVGVCLKITYGSLNPEAIIEWFEYSRLMGVSKVFTYHFNMTQQTLRVLQYYQNIHFLEMVPLHPPVSKDGPQRGFHRSPFEQQAWVDEVMAANDCKHRMAKLDYVIILDMDEYILPKGELQSYYDILHAVTKVMPNACGVSFDSHVVMLDWGPTRMSPLEVCRYSKRTRRPNYDGVDRNSRWAIRPNMTYWVQNNMAFCRKPYVTAPVPTDLYLLLHYRFCKRTWKGCAKRSRENDTSMLKYELALVSRILRLPLSEILPDNQKYVYAMIEWRKKYKNIADVHQVSLHP